MWNCACNGLIFKTGLRFEGEVESSENNYHLPTNRLSFPECYEDFFFFKCKAGQQWRDCNWFYLPPSYVLCSEICPVNNNQPFAIFLLSPSVLVPADHTAFSSWQGVGYLFSLPVTQADLLPTMLFLWFSSTFSSAHFSSAGAAFTFEWGKTHSVVL